MIHSIIISKNNEGFISGAINSLRSQTLKPSRITIYDLGSTDRTKSLIKKADISDIPMDLVELTDLHDYSFVRNIALADCQEDYISFLNGSNLFNKTKLEKSLEYISRQNIFSVYSDVTIFNLRTMTEERIFYPSYDPRFIMNGFIPELDNVLNVKLAKTVFKDSDELKNWQFIAQNYLISHIPLPLHFVRVNI